MHQRVNRDKDKRQVEQDFWSSNRNEISHQNSLVDAGNEHGKAVQWMIEQWHKGIDINIGSVQMFTHGATLKETQR